MSVQVVGGAGRRMGYRIVMFHLGMLHLGPMRPRRVFVVPAPHGEVLAAVRAAVGRAGGPCHGVMSGNHLELLVDPAERHFWSPWLSVDLLPDPRGTRVKCRYGPHPSLWTAIASLYAVLAFAALAGAVFGGTQALIGHSASGLWALPISLGLAVALYAGSQIGQRLGADQMDVLDGFLAAALPIEPEEATPPG